MKTQKIGFIGGGNMASSLISGLIASGHSPEHLWVSDINPDTLHALAQNLNVNTSASNDKVISEVDVVVLAVKPQTLSDVAKAAAAVKMIFFTEHSLTLLLFDNWITLPRSHFFQRL